LTDEWDAKGTRIAVYSHITMEIIGKFQQGHFDDAEEKVQKACRCMPPPPIAECRCDLHVDIRQLDAIISIRDTGCHFPSPSSVFVILGDPIAANMSGGTLAN
jgi:hypothetical protein